MEKNLYIDASHPNETRIVLKSANSIEEYEYEDKNNLNFKNNIYLATISRVEPSLQAAFVNFGRDRHGFLAFNDIQSDYFQLPSEDKEKIRIAGVVGTIFEKLGFTSPVEQAPRRAVPQILSDDEVEPIETETIEESSLQLPTPPAAQPTTALASAAPVLNQTVAPPPVASGKVDRSRFAAMFPEDRALIEGIGSLMG